VFAVLVVATFAAFFVTQRLKHGPAIVQRFMATPYFSPVGVGPFVEERLSFRIKRSDEVTVTVVNERGDDVATVVRSLHLPRYHQISLRWDGRTDSGQRAPDGLYRVRVRLQRQARSVLLPRLFRLNTTPPHPRVTSIGPSAGSKGAPILPETGGRPLVVRFDLDRGRRPELLVYRTDVSPAKLVTALPVPGGATSVIWNAMAGGRSLEDGTYLIAIRDRDRPGNVGSTPSPLPPRPAHGEVVPGHAGFTVRHLGATPPVLPAAAGHQVSFGIDSRGQPFAYAVQRVGVSRPRARGRGRGPILNLRAPGGISGVYLLRIGVGRSSVVVPFAVQGASRQPVLVVLPAATWLGEQSGDEDGDGLPDTLARGLGTPSPRVFAGSGPHGGSGLPAGFGAKVAPLIGFLDRARLGYDITTDLALAAGQGPALAGHSGVLLAGDERWLPAGVSNALQRFVAGGGRLASLGVDSLRRTVRVAPGRLSDPSGPAQADLFGARLGALRRSPATLTNLRDSEIGLFEGTTGRFEGFQTYEPTESVGSPARLVASAVTPDGRPVIVAARYGRGLVIRTGLPELPGALARNRDAAALMRRIWRLLR
jgi:hypothetical protein